MRRLPGPAVSRLGEEGNFRDPFRIVSGLAEDTNSIFCDSSSELEAANGCPVLRGAGTISREATVRERRSRPQSIARSPERAQESCAFLLTLTYIEAGDSTGTCWGSKQRPVSSTPLLMKPSPSCRGRPMRGSSLP